MWYARNVQTMPLLNCICRSLFAYCSSLTIAFRPNLAVTFVTKDKAQTLAIARWHPPHQIAPMSAALLRPRKVLFGMTAKAGSNCSNTSLVVCR